MIARRIVAGLMLAALAGCGQGSAKPVLPTKEYGPIQSDTEVPKGGKRKPDPDANGQQELKEG